MRAVVGFFLKLGFLGFGGPLATIAMMENEAVTKNRWITQEQFAKIYAIIKVLPGPAAVQMSIYLGKAKAGRLGGLLAGLLFIFPSFLIVLAISYFYDHARWMTNNQNPFVGMQVAALVFIADSVVRMSAPYKRNLKAGAIALAAALIIFLKPTLEPLIILAFGMFGILGFGLMSVFLMPGTVNLFASPNTILDSRILNLAWVCFKAGAFVFGTGLAIIPLLEGDVVGHYHWLTHNEFLDGLAVGQVTPGPFMITATFIGFRVARLWGAVVATFAIFAPAFLNMLFLIPFFEGQVAKSQSRQQALNRFSQWAIPAVIGGIAGTTLKLGLNTVNNTFLFLLLVGISLVVYLKRPPVWLVIPGAGVLCYFLR